MRMRKNEDGKRKGNKEMTQREEQGWCGTEVPDPVSHQETSRDQ